MTIRQGKAHESGGKAGTNPQYHYTINDHLGNTRLVYSDLNGNGRIENATEILQENHYYPFGMKMKGAWMGDEDEYRYKYNGIEEVDDYVGSGAWAVVAGGSEGGGG